MSGHNNPRCGCTLLQFSQNMELIINNGKGKPTMHYCGIMMSSSLLCGSDITVCCYKSYKDLLP